MFVNGDRLRLHHIAGRHRPQIQAFFHKTAQITIRKNTDDLTCVFDNGRCAESLVAHLAHEFTKACARPDARKRIALAHHVADMCEQAASQSAAWM